MLLISHIFIAVAGIAMTTVAYLLPSKYKINISISLALLTLVSGIGLVLINNANLLKTCISGILYLSFVSIGIYSASRKLAIKVKAN